MQTLGRLSSQLVEAVSGEVGLLSLRAEVLPRVQVAKWLFRQVLVRLEGKLQLEVATVLLVSVGRSKLLLEILCRQQGRYRCCLGRLFKTMVVLLPSVEAKGLLGELCRSRAEQGRVILVAM